MKRLKTKNIKSFLRKRFSKKSKRIIMIGCIIAAVFLLYGVFYEVIITLKNRSEVVEKNTEIVLKNGEKIVEKDNIYYYVSLSQSNPILLQNLFLEDVKKGINDKYTKAKIYFIMRRYIDNGGNIYELYDYVESHPELAFLKEAEAIHPDIFEQIKNRRLPFTYSDQGMYAYLAYAEVLERYGYADVATLGTAASQYSTMAYYKRMIRGDKVGGKSLNYPDYTESDVKNDVDESTFFAEKIKDDIVKILDKKITAEDIPALDILYGIDQYASALRYFDALGVPFSSPKTSREVFSFATGYAYQFVPGMYLTTALSNAATLLLAKESTTEEIRNALYPFFDFHPVFGKSNGIVDKIIQVRYVKTNTSRYSDLSIYSRTNIVELGNRVPEFKTWLMSNGWKESDFK